MKSMFSFVHKYNFSGKTEKKIVDKGNILSTYDDTFIN